jgi:hypothetical protein
MSFDLVHILRARTQTRPSVCVSLSRALCLVCRASCRRFLSHVRLYIVVAVHACMCVDEGGEAGLPRLAAKPHGETVCSREEADAASVAKLRELTDKLLQVKEAKEAAGDASVSAWAASSSEEDEEDAGVCFRVCGSCVVCVCGSCVASCVCVCVGVCVVSVCVCGVLTVYLLYVCVPNLNVSVPVVC